jgi:serine phosphatase RsbU (regulator of sigma subunit)
VSGDVMPDHGLPTDTPLGAIADDAFDRIAGLVRTVLHVPVGLVSLVDRDRQVFPGLSGLPEPWAASRTTPLTHSFCQYVVRTAEPLVVADARLDPVLRSNRAIPDLGVIAYAGVPIVDLDGSVVGSLCAIDTVPRDWTVDELALLADLAATCSAELQLRTAAVAAREAQGQASAFLTLSETLSNTLTTNDISQAVSKLSTDRLGAAFGGITVVDDAAETLTYVDLGALPAQVADEYRTIPLSRCTPSTTVAMSGSSFFFDRLDEMRVDFAESAGALERSDMRSAAYLPLQVSDRIVGTLSILWAREQHFGLDDEALLNGLARYTAQAVQRAQLLADRREMAETLQAAMLPSLPSVDWVELAGRYLPARVAAAVGGDWYDAFELSARELAISVGDVEGHDTEAAAVMGNIRSTLRALTVTLDGAPDERLLALDRVLTTLPTSRYATGVLGTVTQADDGTVSLAWSNAGHLPPLLVVPDSAPTFLDRRPSPPLGLRLRRTTRHTDTVTLPAGSTLLLFTDGLVERRDAELDETLRELAESAGRHRQLALADMVESILGDMLPDHHEDDVVLFALRLTSAV